jgi:glycosyltransferase involved in cell wall biosynthesis
MSVHKYKFTIITVTYNAEKTVEDTICSVLSQTYPDVEYIIVDGASDDGTLSIIDKYCGRISRVISEPDKGPYDAMNKGIAMATGDIIGLLHSDDMYTDINAISRISEPFNRENVDSAFGDLVFVEKKNTDRITRYYCADDFSVDSFAYGCMPPHPTFFAKKECYDKYGTFKADYRIAADFELVARFLLKFGISYRYVPGVLVKMRMGGTSTRSLKSNIILNSEILRACRENGINTNILKIYSKYITKVSQKFRRP